MSLIIQYLDTTFQIVTIMVLHSDIVKEEYTMNKKAILAVVVALLVGIGGTMAYFYIHSLYVANTAPPITAAPAAPAPNNAAIPAANNNQSNIPPAGLGQVPPAQGTTAGTLTDDQLVLGQISYGASIDAVRQRHGEPHEIDRKGTAVEYEYKHIFDLYVTNGIVTKIKVDDLNGLGTAKGIKVGSSADEVIAAYGQPNAVLGDHMIYRSANNPALGLDFEMELNHVEKIECGMLQ